MRRRHCTADTVGKRKKRHAERLKPIKWSAELRAVIDEALSLQRTISLYFSVTALVSPTQQAAGTRTCAGCWRMKEEGREGGIEFKRLTLKDMRPAAVTDRVDKGKRSRTLPGTVAIAW